MLYNRTIVDTFEYNKHVSDANFCQNIICSIQIDDLCLVCWLPMSIATEMTFIRPP